MGIEKFDPNNAADVNAIAELHWEHLPGSIVIPLGKRFLKKFYYNKLKKEHSRWTPCKISSIIKLLWKREQIKGKDHKYKTKKISKFLLKDQKRVSGRTFFRAKSPKPATIRYQFCQST